jgi:MoxR-like ATPase
LSDALRRRCLYLWIDHPTLDKELRILRMRRSNLPAGLARDVARFVQRLRESKLYKTPGVAETLDWAEALELLGIDRLDEEVLRSTLGCLLKDRHDIAAISENGLGEILEAALAE